MATELNKNLVRVSTDKVDNKEILVMLKADQSIELKLKGSRGSGKNIPIMDLYEQLYGITSKGSNSSGGSLNIKPVKVKKGDKKMISLYDLRSHNAVSTLSIDDIAKFDQIIKSVIENLK